MVREWLHSVRLRARALALRGRLERDLRDEMAFHLAMREEELRSAGMDAESARHAARRAFGNETSLRERSREMWRFAAVEAWMTDLADAARGAARRPGFLAVVTLLLTLGVGANTAVFGFLSTFFLRPLPLPEPTRLVRVFRSSAEAGPNDVFSYPDFVDLRERNRVFERLAVSRRVDVNLSTAAEPENAHAELVSGDYFAMMGVPPIAGRTIGADDDRAPGAHPLAVLGRALAERRFGDARVAVGRKVALDGFDFTVIGVMPASFRGTHPVEPADLWVPLMMYQQVRTGAARRLDLQRRSWGWLSATGRLRPGVTLAQAGDDLARLSRELAREHPAEDGDATFVVHPARALPDETQAAARRVLGFCLALTAVLLLVAAANVAAMLLARSALRAREVAIRQSLGAPRWRLVRRGLLESVFVALPGGVGGLAAAALATRLLARSLPAQYGELASGLGFDPRTVLFALGATLAAGLAAGLTPALAATRTDLTATLREGGYAASSRRGGRVRAALVVAQSAASLILLVVAALLVQTLRNERAFDPGFRGADLWLASVDAERAGYSGERAVAFYDALRERVLALPQVERAAYAASVPLALGQDSTGIVVPGQTPPNGRSYRSIPYNVVGPGYFATMSIPLLAGREFEAGEARLGAPAVAIVNQTFARRFFPDESPVGRTIRYAGEDGAELTIVGEARDIAYYAPGEEPRPFLYLNPNQTPDGAAVLQIRARPGATGLAAALRREAAALDPNALLADIQTFEQARAVALFPSRAMSLAAAFLAALVLALSALGLYGLVSWSVARRTREIGVRQALGASPREVVGLELRRGLRLALIGGGLGLAGGLAAALALRGELFGLHPLDPWTHLGGVALLLAVSLAACWLPARRATRIVPSVALREE
jgi:predicted permease